MNPALIQPHIDRDSIDSYASPNHLGNPAFLLETPLWKLPGERFGVPGCEVWLKLEHLQVAGSFKARGMMARLRAALSAIGPAALKRSGVTIASGGNAGIALAAAAQALGVPCEVFVPEVSSAAKRARLAHFGARVVVGGAAYSDAYEACALRQRATGALMAHAYDQPEVVLGAGTLAREIEMQAALDAPIHQAAGPDTVLVSVGGGGLIGGVAAWFEKRAEIVALEPELAPTLHAARAAGEPVDVPVGGIAADALGARRIGAIAWEITQRYVGHSLLVADDAIKDAQRFLWNEFRLAVEPAAALGIAALRTGAWKPAPGERVCVILCGGNFDPATLNA